MKQANHVLLLALLLAVLASSGCKKSEEANPEYVLTVQCASGVDGFPSSGSSSHAQGATVAYGYTASAGYENLHVILDNQEVTAGGTVTMDRDHALAVTVDRTLYFLGNWQLDIHWTSQTCALEDALNVTAKGTQNGDAITLIVSDSDMTASGTIDLQGNFVLTAEVTYTNQTKFKFTFTGKMSGKDSFAGEVAASGYLNDQPICTAAGNFSAQRV